MEEIILLFFICLLGGSAVYLYYYPIYTICALLATATLTYRWWQKKQLQLDHQAEEQQRLERVQRYPQLARVYISDFELTLRSEIQHLKKDLLNKGQTEVLGMLQSMEGMVSEKILPRKSCLKETLDHFTTNNQLVLQDELLHHKGELSEANEENMAQVLESTIHNIEEKLAILKKHEEDLVYFYSQIKNILLQIENMRLKSSRLTQGDTLALDLKQDLNQTLEEISDANSLLDDLSAL
jgi:hypothetical protein